MAEIAYIGLGSNIGHRVENIFTALYYLSKTSDVSLMQNSSLYETEPVGLENQPFFINGVVSLKSNLNPNQLLAVILEIEKRIGRIREQRWGPRIIDLDLLSFGSVRLKNKDLTLPHKELVNRRFVLVPFDEISPDYEVPGTGQSIHNLLLALKDNFSVTHYLAAEIISKKIKRFDRV